jgi:uncharacterized alpha/beta hydrolase family protein
VKRTTRSKSFHIKKKETAYAQSETDFILRRSFIYRKCSSTKAAIKNKAHENRKCKTTNPAIHLEGARGQQEKLKQLISNLSGKSAATKYKATITNSNSYSS